MATSLPSSVIIVGAGVFGLSTALAIERRSPSTTITVIDRHEPPVPDGASADGYRIIRPDYVDKEYRRLAEMSQIILKNDPELQTHYSERGFTFCSDGKEGPMESLREQMYENARETLPASMYDYLETPDDIFHYLHGDKARPVSAENLGREKRWAKGYTSKRCAIVDSDKTVKAYYDRARAKPNISFVVGVPVDRLLHASNKNVEGVILEDGRIIRAEKTVLATGAWSSRLANLPGVMQASAVAVCNIKLTEDEYEKYKDIGCYTNLTTGTIIFTPLRGLLKVLKRSTGLVNTIDMLDPEDPSKTYRTSYPQTAFDDPLQTIPAEDEAAIRDELREMFPVVADRPFTNTKISWFEQTTTGDFLICPHPQFANLHMATGDSLHAWKFLPLLGEFVADSMTGSLSPELVKKWSCESKENAQLEPFAFMKKGSYRELWDIERSRVSW